MLLQPWKQIKIPLLIWKDVSLIFSVLNAFEVFPLWRLFVSVPLPVISHADSEPRQPLRWQTWPEDFTTSALTAEQCSSRVGFTAGVQTQGVCSGDYSGQKCVVCFDVWINEWNLDLPSGGAEPTWGAQWELFWDWHLSQLHTLVFMIIKPTLGDNFLKQKASLSGSLPAKKKKESFGLKRIRDKPGWGKLNVLCAVLTSAYRISLLCIQIKIKSHTATFGCNLSLLVRESSTRRFRGSFQAVTAYFQDCSFCDSHFYWN